MQLCYGVCGRGGTSQSVRNKRMMMRKRSAAISYIQCLVTCQSLTSSTSSCTILCMSAPYRSSSCWLRCRSPKPISISCSIGVRVCIGTESTLVTGGDHGGGGVQSFSGGIQTACGGAQPDCGGVQFEDGGAYCTQY